MTALAVQGLTEFFGMFLFIFWSLGGVQAGIFLSPKEAAAVPTSTISYIAITFGISLATAIFITYRISGGALNPAVNLGLALAGVMPWLTALIYTVAQTIGATLACWVVSQIFPGKFAGANKVFAPTTQVQGFFLEALLTMGLVLVVLFLAVEKSKVTFLAPIFIGLYVFAAHMISIPYTNTSINPARSFGASVVAGEWDQHHIFWLGPAFGAALAGLIYRALKFVGYETLNPGQDADTDKMV
ncbi:hypothetical protein HDU97_006575 [Phlyctochytrium planicorne]|nr:hypothetical protein HDU97_006575 [Phlyctochytrium planicorne]